MWRVRRDRPTTSRALSDFSTSDSRAARSATRNTAYGARRCGPTEVSRAPSVHNTQPWRWEVGERSVHLYADRGRQVPATDPDGRDLVISCGAALHHARIALAAEGWETTVHRVPDPARPDHLAALEPYERTPTDEDISLATAITERRTDRRRMSSWPVPGEYLDLMVERARITGALLVPVSEAHTRVRLERAMSEAAARQESRVEYALEIAEWSGRSSLAEDGVLAASAPARQGPDDLPLREFPGGTLVSPEVDRWDHEEATLLVLATTADDLVSRLRAGEAASAVLLTATDLGLATTPLSQPLEITDTRSAIAEEVLDGGAIPQLLIRIGWAPTSADPLPVTPRRALADAVSELDKR